MANIVEILITAKNLTGPAMAGVNARVNAASGSMRAFHKTAALAGAGIAALGYESVKMAAKFDSSMTLLHTQAGVAQDKMAGLKKGVLALAGKVGQDPDSLAESLFHVESNFESMGISSKKALSLVETAAKGATTGHADLVDVTNALTAAVASGIPGVQNFDKAMGVLNATVGVGDMKMQDLASAFSSGMVATVKGFGLSITDVGAALAVFGDNNIRGSLAGNQLRMSVMALAKPVSTAKDSLDKLGLKTDTLAKDMQKGGLKLALEDLVDRMHKAGISSKEQGQIITDAFGRKAGAGLNILVGQMDRLRSKYPALEEGANKFGEAWKDTQKTFAFQMKALQGSFDSLMISMGTKLIPPLQAFVSLLLAHKGAATAAAAGLAGLLAATVAVSAAMKVAAASTIVWNGAARGVTALRGVFDTLALRAMYMREAFIAAGGGVAGLRAAFASLGAVGKASVVIGGLALLALAVAKIADLGKSAPPDIEKLSTSLKDLSNSGKFSGELAKSFGDMDGLVDKVKRLNTETAKSKETAFGFRIPGLDDAADSIANAINNMSKGKNSLDSLKGDFKSLDEAMAGLASGGHADAAARDFDMMRDSLKGAGYSTRQINALFPQYRASLAGLAADQKITAESMGLFGEKAVATQHALDGEAQSAKGLEQSIMALNAVHRGAFDAETAFHQALSDTQKALKENGKTLSLNSDNGRKNRDVLSQMAAKTEDLVDKKLKEKASWEDVDKTYKQGRQSIIDFGTAVLGSKAKAEALADTLLKAPAAMDVKVKADTKTAEKQLRDFNAAVKKAPGTKSVTLKALSKGAEQVLSMFGYKVQHLKDGSVRVTAKTGGALGLIAQLRAALDALNGKTATTYVKTVKVGGTYGNKQVPLSARGGLQHRAGGGPVQYFDEGGYVQGPGSGTSDSIYAMFASGAQSMVSNGEYVMKEAAVRRYGVRMMDALNSGRLPIAHLAKGGKVSKQAQAEREARNEARGDLSISRFGWMAGYRRDEFSNALGRPDGIGSLVTALNQWRSIIQKSTHGGTESRLLKQLDSTGRSLLKYEKQLQGVTKSLETAKTKLNSLKDAASSLASSVKGGILSSANITKGSGEGGPVTVASIMGGLTQSRDKATAFADALKQLKGRGLSSSLLQQIAEAGIDGGGLDTAGALLGASGSEIKSINDLQGQIGRAAGAAGKTTADAVYGAQIKAQQKLVNDLAAQQKRLTSAMDRLTKAMEKAIKSAFGKKASGGIVGAAASGGLRSSMTWVGEQGPELLDLPAGSRVWSNPDSRRKAAGAWGSMLNTPRRGPSHAGAGGTQEVKVVLEIRAGDSGAYSDFLVTELRKAVRNRGGMQATFQPPRGR